MMPAGPTIRARSSRIVTSREASSALSTQRSGAPRLGAVRLDGEQPDRLKMIHELVDVHQDLLVILAVGVGDLPSQGSFGASAVEKPPDTRGRPIQDVGLAVRGRVQH